MATLGADPVAAVWAEIFTAEKKVTKQDVEKYVKVYESSKVA